MPKPGRGVLQGIPGGEELYKAIGQQARGAIANGVNVEKVHSQPDDTHGDGCLATVVGSLRSGVPGPRPLRLLRDLGRHPEDTGIHLGTAAQGFGGRPWLIWSKFYSEY